MVYKVKIYTYKRFNKQVVIKCGDEYLKGLKDDLLNNDLLFLDCEDIIIPKNNIKKIVIKNLSDN